MSEDPIRFAVWCRIRPGRSKAAAEELQRHQPGVSLLEAMKAANRSLASATPFLIAPLAGWKEACALRESPPGWAEEVSVFQAGYGPDKDRLSFCARHRLWYGGVLGCHVCQDFFTP